MPELPEVETVKNGLNELLPLPVKISAVVTSAKSLRFKYPYGIKTKLKNKQIQKVQRRAKYLIFDLGDLQLISHLGMTGTWRKEARKYIKKQHDHFILNINDQFFLIYNDPRRFGYIDLIDPSKTKANKWFQHLGLEPLTDEFNAEYLFEKLQRKTLAIKSAIMDQKLVVGVGNICASECLFLSKIHPGVSANTLTLRQCRKLVKNIKSVIAKAIEAGGTTISDFRQAGGSKGYFQQQLFVYGRQGKPCFKCNSRIKLVKQSGRSSFYCPKCQR